MEELPEGTGVTSQSHLAALTPDPLEPAGQKQARDLERGKRLDEATSTHSVRTVS